MLTAGWLRYRAVRHVAFWAISLGLNLLMQLPAYFFLHTPPYTWGLLLVQLPADLLTIYPLLYWLLPGLLRRRPLAVLGLAGWLVGASLLVSVLSWYFDFVWNPRLTGTGAAIWSQLADVLWRVRAGYFVLLITAGVAVSIKVMGQWRAQWRLSQELLQRQQQTELQLLKAQLQPPFLFGTLEMLQALTARKAPEAPAAVLHLSGLLRYMLYESPLDAVPLADEVAMLRNYVALEQLRLAGRVDVSLHFGGELANHHIAPLLLLPLLENAFRHGPDAGQDCAWVSIDLVARPQSVSIKIINGRAPTAAPDLCEGVGLQQLRQRLAHLYPDRHELKIVAEPDTVLAALVLRTQPATTPAMPATPTQAARPHARHPAISH